MKVDKEDLTPSFPIYVSDIHFRFIKPNMALPRGYGVLSKLLEKIGFSLEFINTRIPYDERSMKRRLYEICKIPKMSTFAIGAIINWGVSQMPDTQAFVNVGVWHGFTLLTGMVNNKQKKCIGIDNFSEFGRARQSFHETFNKYKSPNHYFYEMDYTEYFSNVHKESIGFYVYDGNHSYDNQLKGLQVAERFFSKDCIILIDDTNCNEPRQATIDFISSSSYKYKILLDKTTYFKFHPTLWNGIMIFQRIG